MYMSSMTTIRVSRQTKDLLDDLKHHPKESYEDVIGRLATMAGDDEPLSQEEIGDMKASQADIEAGRITTIRSIRKSLYDTQKDLPEGVCESAGEISEAGIESRLRDIVDRLDRIEEEIFENIYPPESALKPEFIRKIKKARADIRKGKGKTYESMDAFIKAISE